VSEAVSDPVDGPDSPPPITPALMARLRRELGAESVLEAPGELKPYESDAMPLYRRAPVFVLLPPDAATAVRAVKLLAQEGVPWAPRGAGTGLSGGALAPEGGAVVSLARLRRIVKIDPRARRARVEAGVVNGDLGRALEPFGLTFAPDPSSQAVSTIGGNLGENAGGPHTLKRGVTSAHLLGVRLALGDGAVIEVGGEEETMGGYDLVGLLVGSEGTLGLAIETTVRLTPLPETVRTFLAAFESVPAACHAVTSILQAGIVPAALEMIDAVVLETLETAFGAGLPLDAGALLVGDLDGSAAAVAAELDEVGRLLAAGGAREVRVARSQEEADRLWRARKKAFGSLGRVSPNYLSHDAVVPRTRLPEVLERVAQIAAHHGLRIANIFHAGDGNLHPTILFDAGDAEQSRRARQAGVEILRACLAAEGVLTGEHGVGLSKRDAMRLVFSAGELTLMDRLRRIFDPLCRLNPGKLLPDGPGTLERTPTPDEARLIDAIRAANERREPLLPRGAGTLAVGAGHAAALRTEELRRYLRHDPADMTVTVEAGVTLAEIQARLARERQTLAWEAPHPERATIGGIVAAGFWSSRALGTLHPKHSVLGLRAVTGEGELIEFGGRVMKNVAGYDVPKLLVGSRGSLAVLTRLILRTYPLASHRALAVVEGAWDELLALAAALLETGAPWTECDLLADAGRATLLVGGEGRTRFELAEMAAVVDRAGAPALRWCQEDEAEATARSARDWLDWDRAAVILRLVASPARARALAERARAHCAEAGAGLRGYRLQASPGIGLLRIAIDPGFAEAPLRRLLLALGEEVRAAHGYRALDRAPADHWWGWDPWGAPTELRERMRRIKIAFDPRGILAPWDGEG
jgi:glycolate oxidase subunit GlcD